MPCNICQPLAKDVAARSNRSYEQHSIEMSHLLHPDGLKLRRITAESIGRIMWLLYKGVDKALVPQRTVENLPFRMRRPAITFVLLSVACVKKEFLIPHTPAKNAHGCHAAVR